MKETGEISVEEPKKHFFYYDGDFKGWLEALPPTFGYKEGEYIIEDLGGGKYKLVLDGDKRWGKWLGGVLETLEPYKAGPN
jgi:hypothetical protein